MTKNKLLALLIASSFVFLTVAFTTQEQQRQAKNLKVLPKDISHEDLDKVMDGFKVALGVKCNFCHAQSTNDPKKLDFASDVKPEKETARMMMRMTNKINKKYFGHVNPEGIMNQIACVTCHNGEKHPKTKEIEGGMRSQ